jgi:gliding motility-associated-like protein
MRKSFVICALYSFCCFAVLAQSVNSATGNPRLNYDLSQKVFIENKGQFDKADGLRKSQIQFVIDNKTKFYFTPKGLTYKFTDVEVEAENGEKEKEEREGKYKLLYEYAHMEWVDANVNVQIEAGEKSEGYYCFGSETKANTIIANGYKKITYKDLYPHIDVEYFFHEVEGIKYNIILHPGADPSRIKMRYSSNKELSIDASGNLHIGIKGKEDIIDHTPVSYFQNNAGKKINSSYVIDKNTVSFKIEDHDNTQTLIIDPWTTNPNFTGNNKAFNIHKDAAGNLYASGGYNPYYLRKFSPSGAFIWNFNLPNNSNYNVDNVVDPGGTSYICYGPWLGNNTSKVSPAGVQIFNNTSANNSTSYTSGEAYELAYNTSTNRLYTAGYFIGAVNVWEENLTNGDQFGHINACSSIIVECRSMETDNITGDVYVLALPLASANSTVNHLIKMNQNLGVLWDVTNGYNMTESQQTYYPHSFSQLNGLAVGCSFLYTCDGLTVKKWNKSNGAMIGTPVNVPNGSVYMTSGLFVDPCGDVYVGSTNGVYKYDQNLTFINSVATPDTVYDICAGNIAGEVIAAGKGFINSLNFGGCTSSSACFTQLSPYSFSICAGASATLNVPNPNNLQNPTFSVQPGSLTSPNPTFVVNPSIATTYSVYVTGTLNSSVITQSTTISVGIFPTPTTNVVLSTGNCSNPGTNSVNLNVSFTPSVSTNYTLNWSPLPSTVTTVNSATAAGLVQGLNNVTITAANGCSAVVSFSVPPVPQPASFVIVNPSNDYTITCLNPNVALTTSITNGVPLSFTWFPVCTNTLVGPSMNFNQACTGQVVGQSSTGCQFTQTFTIYQNFISPTIAITPTINNITCAGGSGCFTLTSNLHPNITTNWYTIVGTNTVYVGVPQGSINIFCATQPGIYWGESIYNVTGCRSTKSVQVTASVGVPVFTVTSPTNFTIGCGSKSVTSMQVPTVVTSPVANVSCNYTFMIPPVTSTPTTFTANPNLNNITVPGIYVVYVQDQTNNCVSSQSINIIQNIIPPNISFIQPLSILSCRDPSMVLTGISSNTNTNISWTVPAIPSNSVNPTPNATVYINPAITGATNNVTAIGIWTVGAIDNNNFCTSTKTVQINQDIRLPKFTITAQSNSVINCSNPDVVIIPVVSNTLAVALVPTYVWYPPVGNPQPGSSYNTTVAGSHTCISTSVVNGCTYTANYIVAIDLIPPAIDQLTPSFTLDCATIPSVVIRPVITGTTTGFTYSWTQIPAGAITSALTGSALTTNQTGFYVVVVTNTINGCKATGVYQVVEGAIHADFTANPDNGFAPLDVTFNNTSSTSTGASSIISSWGYGNGMITANIMNTVPGHATYTASGTYTVILTVKKGTCIDTAMRIVTVDIASRLEIPNVFTPNGDKSNDIFRLRASSLKEIYIIIYDRWGTKVYEVTSDTGNFAWDGKNQFGKDCSDGVYFYVIKAKGKDEKEFEQKGNVSLFR